MKIGVTGSNGLLGSSLLEISLARQFKPVRIERRMLTWSSLEGLVNYIGSLQIETLIHCAANTDVEGCEANPRECYRDNVALTELLLTACSKLSIKFVFISSTGVYGSYQDNPYHDYDDVKPVTVHHRSKTLAEQLVQSYGVRPLIIRTGWLYGGRAEMPKNFVMNRICEARNSNGIISSDESQIGNPTFVEDLASHILKLVSLGYMGTFNCVNKGCATRYEYVSTIIRQAVPSVKVTPVSATYFDRLAKVSHNESAENSKLKMFGLDEMPQWQYSLRGYIARLVKETSDG